MGRRNPSDSFRIPVAGALLYTYIMSCESVEASTGALALTIARTDTRVGPLHRVYE